MRITEVLAYPVEMPYIKPWVISGGPTSVAANVLVQIVADNGLAGVGEGSPVPAYGDETQGTILHAIRDNLAGVLIGRDPFDEEAIFHAMDKRLHGHHFAKSAIDLALYDLRGKALGVPVYQLLGGIYRDKIELIEGVGLGDTETRVREAVEAVQKGFTIIKMKISGNPELDIEQVGAVRAAVGPKIRLRLDANQGYRSGDCLPVFKKLESFGLDYIEQPLPRWDLDGQAALAAALDTPIMGDESCYTPEDVMTLIRHKAVDIVNIKIMKSGLFRSRKIAAIAEAAGLPCMIGSMVELGVGTAAGVHFGIATPAVTYACELVGAAFLVDDVCEGNPYTVIPPDHCWRVPAGAGLGVTLKKQYDPRR
jgi:o-succinylbenzoate synthase